MVAEGVEDQETCDLLAGMHCDAVQGYHVARPMDMPDFMAWLKARRVEGGGVSLSALHDQMVEA